VSTQDPLLDFQPESAPAYADAPDSAPVSATWPGTSLPIYASDTTSRVISFVLGFALASLVAWLGSIGNEEAAVRPIEERVAAAVTPVVTAATYEKISATPENTRSTPADPAPAAPAVTAASIASPSSSRAASTRAAPARPAPPQSIEAQQPRPSVKGYRGGLALSSSPAGAQVLMNGKVVGETPVVLSDLPVGSRAVIVRREGYSTWSTSVRIIANQRTTVKATLVPSPTTGG
jgi:PEGA domain-containing protein